MDNDADWVHYLNKFVANPTNCFSECAHLVLLSLKKVKNISAIGLFMNIYEACILVLDEEPFKMEVLK